MRVLLDTNVLLSKFLAKSQPYTVIDQLLTRAMRGDYALLVPEEVIDEMKHARAKKRFLAERISVAEMEEFIELLRDMAEIVPWQTEPIPAVLRDPRDDFLLTAAALANADYLVTGDRDLLDIRQHLDQPRILTAAEFLALDRF